MPTCRPMIVVAILVFGCSNGPAPVPSSFTPEEFWRAFQEEQCRANVECCTDAARHWSSVEECTAANTSDFIIDALVGLVADPRLEWQPDGAAQTIQAFRDAALACREPFSAMTFARGLVPDGGDCSGNLYVSILGCVPGLVCADQGGGAMRCMSPSARGQTCTSSSQCASSDVLDPLACFGESMTCESLPSSGAPCVLDANGFAVCAPYAWCDEATNTCESRLVDGETCCDAPGCAECAGRCDTGRCTGGTAATRSCEIGPSS